MKMYFGKLLCKSGHYKGSYIHCTKGKNYTDFRVRFGLNFGCALGLDFTGPEFSSYVKMSKKIILMCQSYSDG